MRRILLGLALLLLPALGAGQGQNFGGNGSIQTFAGVPTGTCASNALAVNTLNANLYSCLAGVWTTVGSGGALTPTSVTGTSNPGTFTNAAENQPFLFTVGVPPCPMQTIIGGTTKVTDGLSGCVKTPSSGVTNGFSNGVGGYIQVNDPNQGGQFGKVQGVGVYGAAECAANNTKCEGISPQVYDLGGLTGTVLIGTEIGVVPQNTTTTGFGALWSFESGTVQPAGDNMPAAVIQTPGSTGTWTSGFACQDGSVSTNNCFIFNKTAPGNGRNSQSLVFNATDLTPTNFSATLGLNQDNILLATTPRIAVNNTTGEESYSVLLTATAALAKNTLVKVGVNADSVVVCTTADVTCLGFVSATNTTNGLCTVGSAFCGVATIPGSKVTGILGTGTCAIGNFVIVDTTTNGRVKCTATAPPANAMIGIAVSAQAVVGSLVDLIMTGQPQTAAAAAPLPVYNNSGTLQAGAHAVQGSGTLSGGTLTVTLSGAAVYTSSSTYTCTADDSTGLNGMDVTYASGSSVTFNGTTTDTFRYMCIGN